MPRLRDNPIITAIGLVLLGVAIFVGLKALTGDVDGSDWFVGAAFGIGAAVGRYVGRDQRRRRAGERPERT